MSNETKIKEIENKIKRFESLLNIEIKDIKEEFEALKQKEPEQEPWPDAGDEYFCVDTYSNIIKRIWNGYESDEYRLSTNNCHRTEEQALRHKAYITSPRVRARELVEMCEGFDIHGLGVIALEFDETPKAYTYEEKQPNGGFRFTDFDIAASALISLGEPLIKVALGVTVGEEAERIVREYVGRDE